MPKNLKDIVFVSALRTSIGKLNGAYSKYKSHELGASVIKETLNRTKLDPKKIDEVIMGQVLTGLTGQNPARQSAINANIPIDKTAYVVNQVCGSGLRSVAAAYQSILLNDAKIIVAGG